ncbi:aminoglycoside phosphotransferase family protein [Plantactinospora sp. B24E8]|uniref:aminoglycoside phosphotransferase family protein n=1 Tax=Plantactinospora sp. B24E8 TaxID=3153567 RepID=UPI00325EE803
MFGSKRRPLWDDLPPTLRTGVEELVGSPVTRSDNCSGGFSPGFASRLGLRDGRRVFVKAVDGTRWPVEAGHYRAEAVVTGHLPADVPAARLLSSSEITGWTVLAFECVDGAEPARPWTDGELGRTVRAVARLAGAVTPSPVPLGTDHPRLGGWAELDRDRLSAVSPWSAANLTRLTELEARGLRAAQGDSLVHFDLYPHNILLTEDRVVFVDWPHARLGAPVVDLVTVLGSAAADGLDPEPYLSSVASTMPVEPGDVDAVLAAYTGFLVAGGMTLMPPGLEPIALEKRRLGVGALRWLRQRLG